MDSEKEIDYLLKLIVIGDTGVGKTNLLSRFTRNVYDKNTHNTIGVDFLAVDLTINGKNVKAQLWDTAGQEKYKSIATAYYKNAQGAVIVYDITQRETFENIDNWLFDLKGYSDPDIVIMIVGNKVDLAKQRQVMAEEGEKLAKRKGAYFMEVSGKTNAGKCVNKAFDTILNEVVKKQEDYVMQQNESEEDSIKSKVLTLHKTSINEEEANSCCK